MVDKKFAFESGEVSIALILPMGMGDIVVARKIFNALVALVSNCRIDLFCRKEIHKSFAKAFYGDSKNLNGIFDEQYLNKDLTQKYDVSFKIVATFALFITWANLNKLKSKTPALLQSVLKIDQYNKQNIYPFNSSFISYALHNTIKARILSKNFHWFLSCGGTLSIREDGAWLKLSPEYKSQFDSLKLGKYITIYSDIDKEVTPPKIKTWPLKYLREYVARMKKRFPSVEIVQCGGGDTKIENADRHFLGADLELTKYILANSLLHVGGEGGLIHLATALGTKCLVLFGSSHVYYHGYNQNINLVSEVCSPCMYVWSDGSFRYCARGNKEPPCMLSHTPQTVCEVTCTYLKNKA